MWDRSAEGRWELRRDRHGRPVLQKSQPPEILFIERCVQLLRPGTGRFALVMPNGILNNPALGYVRAWLMANTQILAVVDMARELFQPKNDTQTSMVLARRLSAEERDAARTGTLEYPIFMAIAERVGHDRRGNVLYRRTETGDDLMVTRSETVAEIDPETGEEVLRLIEVQERQVDDDLPDVATAFRRWITTTVRSRSAVANDRLDAYFFTAPGAAASQRMAVFEASGGIPGSGGAQTVGDVAKVWDPPRFARAYAAPAEPGQPYLRPYDVFDYLPDAADTLSLDRNKDVKRLTPAPGTLLQTCSGRNLGPVVVTDSDLAGFALSHDMIRIEVDDEDTRLYLLAYLKTPTGQALLRRGKSGSVIDHVTVADVAAVPLPVLPADVRGNVIAQMRSAVSATESARGRLRTVQAEQQRRWPVPPPAQERRGGWTFSAADLRDRVDAAFYEPRVRAAREQVAAGGVRCGDLAEATLPVRYKRYYVDAATAARSCPAGRSCSWSP